MILAEHFPRNGPLQNPPCKFRFNLLYSIDTAKVRYSLSPRDVYIFKPKISLQLGYNLKIMYIQNTCTFLV